MKELDSILVSSVSGLLSAIITGIVVLIIEYKTGWFASHSPIYSKNRKGSRLQLPTDPVLLSMTMVFVVSTFLLFTIPINMFLSAQTSTVLDNSADVQTSVKTIGNGDTKSFFENNLFISVDYINTYGDNSISFSVGKPGYPNLMVEKVSNGHAVIYDANQIYEIRVTSIVTNSLFDGMSKADFTVTKLQQ